jgi:vacuolar-type H+-ATPase subunit H
MHEEYMKNILSDILDTEKQVEEELMQAQQKASQLKAETEKEAIKQISTARNRAQEIIVQSRQRAKQEAEQLRQGALKEVSEANEQFFNKNKEKINLLINDSINLINKTDF